MSVEYRSSCVSDMARLSNDQLVALMADVVRHGAGSVRRLFMAVAPLLIAFYEGQVQAERAKVEDLERLVQQALIAVYQGRSSYSPCRPFRAWLLDVARLEMLDYQRDASGISVLRGTSKTTHDHSAKLVTREHEQVIHDAQIASARMALNR